ncbi:MAG: EAL domain-containing protein [Eubacteriales bacterium]
MKKLLKAMILYGIITISTVTAHASGVLTPEELALLQEEEIYYIGYSTQNAPVTYFDENGQFTGIAYEVLEAISEEIGVTFEYVDVAITANNDLSFLAFTTLMKNFNTRPASQPYTEFPFLEVRLSSFEGEVQSVGVADLLGINSLDEVREGLESITPTVYENFNQLSDALRAGEIDAMITTSITYAQMYAEMESGEYQIEFLDNTAKYRMFYNVSFPAEKQAIFNKLLANVDEGLLYQLDVQHSLYKVGQPSDDNEGVSTNSLPDSLAQEDEVNFGDGLWIGLLGVLVVVIAFLKYKNNTDRAMEYDKLTGLYSQEMWHRQASRTLKQHPDDIFVILSIDIDNFKYVNEVYGTETGNAVLTELGRVIREYSAKETVTARTSADKFLILTKAENLTCKVNNEFELYSEMREALNPLIGKEYNLTFSVGVFHVKDRTIKINQMVDCAVTARNIGKKVATNTFNVYTEAMDKEREISNKIIASMHAGIENREFVMFYQSKIDIESEKLVGAEALVRWMKDGKLVPPNDFIPVFEKNGFIEQLDYYVLEEVCMFIKSNEDKNFPVISINLSGITLMQDNLVTKIVEIIKKYDITPDQIELEITESAFVNIYEKNIMKLEKLQELGFSISMDDFGTGVSSLQRLNDFPLHTLKVDRSFVVKSTLEKKGATILSSIVQMAKNLQLDTVGEGVETDEQLALLKALGCDMVQGYYYSKPLNGEEFMEKYSEFISGIA